MTAAIFGFAGVVVGAFAQGGWAWWMERRRESWAARKSARLYGPALWRCSLTLSHALEHGNTWGEMIPVLEANLSEWPEHADVFAGTLSWPEWFEIYAATRGLQRLILTAPDDPSTPITEADGEWLTKQVDDAVKGAVYCARVAIAGAKRRPVRDAAWRLRRRITRKDDAPEMEMLDDSTREGWAQW